MQYNALQTIQAFEAGQGQRKERERETAMKGIGNALAGGDITGATAQAFKVDPMYGIQLQQYGDSRNALATRKTIGQQLGAGDYKGGMSTAFAEGELDVGTQIQSMMQNMEQGDREKFAYSIQETAAVAGSLLSYATPEERKQALMSDPQLQKRLEMAGIPLDQALNAPMDNASLEGQMKMGFTAGQIMEMRRADATAKTDQERFDLGYNLDLRRVQLAEEAARAEAEARRLEASAVPVPELGDVKGIRETNEKRFQAFEESQRAFQSMEGLAQQGTGAADIALGFAFFKTFDPNSTVREGEFAQAAGAMGLGDRAISIFARLDKGEQFTPQLRKELVQAAGIAYNNQVADIQDLVERERAFAGRYGINPEDIARDPVRGQGGSDGTVFRGGAVNRIPQPAVQELLSDPSPEAMREFDEVFGRGQAQKIMQQQGRAPSRITF
jgi:hypothetical protein